MSKLITPTLLLVALASCGGGSSTGSVQGLQAPEQVTIVDAAGSTPSTLLLSRRSSGVCDAISPAFLGMSARVTCGQTLR